ncbi:hypothetical protein AB0B95_17040 [Streptomyces hygroscopicus]|nr:hypothetical protein [Streptomyces hygroscopicus]GLV78873.1 hypothetical protein Shyhy02_68730 [Streptomyces hygroscopicus subsp. hygroscopicus]
MRWDNLTRDDEAATPALFAADAVTTRTFDTSTLAPDTHHSATLDG